MTRLWIGLVIAGLAAPGLAQDRLGDVAGKIRLNTESEDQVVIDHSVVASRPRAGGDEEGLVGDLARLYELTDGLVNLVGEAYRGEQFYDAGWRQRVLDASSELQTFELTVRPRRAPGELAGPWNRSLDAAERGIAALESLEQAFATNQPVFNRVHEQLREARDEMRAALQEARAVRRRTADSAAAPILGSAEVERIVGARCGPVTEASPEAERCADRQRQAARTISQRSAATVGLDVPDFNRIRTRCARDQPDDLVLRNACELERAQLERER